MAHFRFVVSVPSHAVRPRSVTVQKAVIVSALNGFDLSLISTNVGVHGRATFSVPE